MRSPERKRSSRWCRKEGTCARLYLGDGGNDGILGHAPREALLADCSTIDIATAREVAATAAESGYEMIDAPVSGGVTGAVAGTLTFMVGGTAAGFERARPVLSAMGRNVVHLGGPGHGQATKICNNMMAGIAITAASEVFCLGEALGLDPKKLYNVLSTSTGQTWMMDHMLPVPGIVDSAASNRNFAPGFKAALMAKDLGLSPERSRGDRHQHAARRERGGALPHPVRQRRGRARLQRDLQAAARRPLDSGSAGLMRQAPRASYCSLTRLGHTATGLTPAENEARDRARQAARRILERRARLDRTSVSELIDTLHEGHRY